MVITDVEFFTLTKLNDSLKNRFTLGNSFTIRPSENNIDAAISINSVGIAADFL